MEEQVSMKNITVNKRLKNLESSFTELFSLLKSYENTSTGLPMLAYNSNDLKVIHEHVGNAISVLLQGLQDMGQLIGMMKSKASLKELHHIGFFIAAISNLTEALNDLRSDTDHVLRERGVMNY